MRTKRESSSRIVPLRFDRQAEANLKFLQESTEALLGVKLTPSILVRRAMELLADRWMNEAVETLAGRSTAEHKMEKLSEFIRTEREELLRAAGRQGDKVSVPKALQGSQLASVGRVS